MQRVRVSKAQCTLTTLAPKLSLPGVLVESSTVSTAPGEHLVQPIKQRNTRHRAPSASPALFGSLRVYKVVHRPVRCVRCCVG